MKSWAITSKPLEQIILDSERTLKKINKTFSSFFFFRKVFYSWKKRLHTLKANTLLFIWCQVYSVTRNLRAKLSGDETQMMNNRSLFHRLPHKNSDVKLFLLSLQQCGWKATLVDFICRENYFLPPSWMHSCMLGKKCQKGHKLKFSLFKEIRW